MQIALLPVLFNQETNQCDPYDWAALRSCLLPLPVPLQNVPQGVLTQTFSFMTHFSIMILFNISIMTLFYSYFYYDSIHYFLAAVFI